MSEPAKAFQVSWESWGDTAGIYAATTACKARYKAYLAAADAGYDPKLTDLRVVRAPGFDCLVPELLERSHGYTIEHAMDMRAKGES